MSTITAKELKALLLYSKKTGIFKWRVNRSNVRAGTICSGHNSLGYIQIMIGKRNYTAHRLAWLYVIGRFPTCQIDHRNRARNDNRWSNLRAATNSQNGSNKIIQKNNTSGIKGVYRKRNRWCSVIMRNGKTTYLGCFQSKHDAGAAYDKASKKLSGGFHARRS